MIPAQPIKTAQDIFANFGRKFYTSLYLYKLNLIKF